MAKNFAVFEALDCLSLNGTENHKKNRTFKNFIVLFCVLVNLFLSKLRTGYFSRMIENHLSWRTIEGKKTKQTELLIGSFCVQRILKSQK